MSLDDRSDGVIPDAPRVGFPMEELAAVRVLLTAVCRTRDY